MGLDTAAGLVIPALVVLLLAVAAFERIASRLGWMPWRRKRESGTWTGSPISSAGVEEFETYFRGTKDHHREFKQSSLMLREEQGDAAPPRTKIDLDAGTANIVIRKPSTE